MLRTDNLALIDGAVVAVNQYEHDIMWYLGLYISLLKLELISFCRLI